MSLHKLTAGTGYEYLTRQVAAQDATGTSGTGLATYYTEKGETPGVWTGAGMSGIDGLEGGDQVSADQMLSLFGSGHHPLATDRIKELDRRIGRPGQSTASAAQYTAATRLGTPYRTYTNDVTAFQREVATRFAALNQHAGLPGDWPIPAQDRARVRTEIAHDFFTAEHGRSPFDARELAATIAKYSRPKTTAVAGYDLTFSPVKSFSVMWALAEPAVAATLEQAHHLAVADAVRFIEDQALFTREGTNGIRQVATRGLVGTAFTHRDSRAGDPDLHTHLAIANKVQTLSADGPESPNDPDGLGGRGGRGGAGKWLAIDGRPLHKMVVAASEHYNTRLEAHARDLLGVEFSERANPDPRKRPVREIAGIDADLCTHFSQRRASVEQRRNVLVAAFQHTHGRPPTPVETLQLAQQATLETREAKHEPRTLAEQREAWMRAATRHHGSTEQVHHMIEGALHPRTHAGDYPGQRVDTRAGSDWFTATARRMVATMEATRATWQDNHVIAEAWRQVRTGEVPTDQQSSVSAMLVEDVLTSRSISLADPARAVIDTVVGAGGAGGPVEPAELRNLDGTSTYAKAHTELFTTTRVLDAEQRLVDAAGLTGGRGVADTSIDMAVLEAAANGVTLNPGQTTLVREMATSGTRLQLAIAPAGSGKTTAMRVLARAWSDQGGTVIGLGPSAAAAAELGEQLDARGTSRSAASHRHLSSSGDTSPGTRRSSADTLAMLTFALDHHTPLPGWAHDIDERTLVVIDEAGMADTISLDTAVQFVLARGASVRLIGDDQQLAAIGAGGVLRDIRATHGALQLSELMRFTDPAEGAASLALREGRHEALGYYLDQQRVHVGDLTTMTDDVFTAWQADRDRGLDTIMLAPTRDLVADLNRRARAHRLHNQHGTQHRTQHSPHGIEEPPRGRTVRLSDGNDASAGDVIITRHNNRSLRLTRTDWVKNGDRWTVLDITPTSTLAGTDDTGRGSLRVQHLKTGRLLTLPASYVAEHTDLGYACTVHTAQGVTADSMHGLATGEESRQHLYTMMTRGRLANHVYLGVVGDGDPHSVIRPDLLHPRTPTDVFEQILDRDASAKSATTLRHDAADPARLLGEAVATYTDALHLAAENTLDRTVMAGLDHNADRIVQGLSNEPAWPVLRAHLLLLGAAGQDPVAALTATASQSDLSSSRDSAAVLDWRLEASGIRNSGPDSHGPLPWLPTIPTVIAQHESWGPYLAQRAELIITLAGQVRERAETSTLTPTWAANGSGLATTLRGDVEVWRAAAAVDPTDRRPTGPPQQQKGARSWQRRLGRRLAGDRTPAIREWQHLLTEVRSGITDDAFTPLLTERLASMSRAGIKARDLLAMAAQAGPLPDDHAAAALWWRISRHVAPAVAARLDVSGQVTTTAWTSQLTDLIGPDRTALLQQSSWWPALASVVNHGLQRGWELHHLLAIDPQQPSTTTTAVSGLAVVVDECQAMIWRASIALDDTPTDDPDQDREHDENLPPEDLQDIEDLFEDLPAAQAAHTGDAPTTTEADRARGERWTPDEDPVEPPDTAPEDVADLDRHDPSIANELVEVEPARVPTLTPVPTPDAGPVDDLMGAANVNTDLDTDVNVEVGRALFLAGLRRELRVIEEETFHTESDLQRQLQRADAWEASSTSRERMLQINAMTQQFFEHEFSRPGAWARSYLAERVGSDLAGHEHFGPGQAPAGWNNLVKHLRGHGVSKEEMVATGVATVASNGHLIDRFRDRLTFPITHPAPGAQAILGFVGRRHPDTNDDRNPKYLNTATTALFSKGAQLFGAIEPLLTAGSTPVIVEGPLDAIAVTVATNGAHVGVAALGTSLSDDHAIQLARLFQRTGRDPVVATDGDRAGRVAAQRDFWQLTGLGLDPAYVQLPEGSDPATMLAEHGPAHLAKALAQTQPLSELLLGDILSRPRRDHTASDAAKVLAAQPSRAWEPGIVQIITRLQISPTQARHDLATAVSVWDADPRQAAREGVIASNDTRTPLEQDDASSLTPTERWAPIADSLDARLIEQLDWTLLAGLMQDIDHAGHDVPAIARRLIHDRPLGNHPARDLRYRLVSHVNITVTRSETQTGRSVRDKGEDQHRQPAQPTRPTNNFQR